MGAQADELVFVPNSTHGMNVIARSIELRPGDEVLGTTHEYGAVERTWRFVCAQRGATYRSSPAAAGSTSGGGALRAALVGVTERTRVLVISHITSPTALVLPVDEICRRAAARAS